MSNCIMTDAAYQHIQKILAKHPHGSFFCLTIQKYGCSGYGFLPSIKQEIPDGYATVHPHSNMDIYVDSKFVKYTNEMKIDLVAKELGQQQLKFINPKLEDECGCGDSFSLPKEE